MTKPCKHGHSGPRYKSGACIECSKRNYKYVKKGYNNHNRIPTGRKARLPDGRRRSDVPEYLILWNAKHRATRKNLEFSLELSDIVIPTHCPVFGIPMESPSLDRIDSSLGYVRGNVRVISKRANSLKSNGTLRELQLIYEDALRIGTK